MSKYKKIGIVVADGDEFSPLADIIKLGDYSEDKFLKRKILKFGNFPENSAPNYIYKH